MSRLILVLLVGMLAFMIIRAVRRLGSRDAKPPSTESKNDCFVACAHCGMHIPEAEAVRTGTLYFCSEPHRRLGPSKK